jgi:hypothetical protein
MEVDYDKRSLDKIFISSGVILGFVIYLYLILICIEKIFAWRNNGKKLKKKY